MTTPNELGARQLLETLRSTRVRLARRKSLLQTRMQETEDEVNDIFLMESLCEQQIESVRELLQNYEAKRKADMAGDPSGESH